VSNFILKFRIENKQRALSANELRVPSSMLGAVKLAGANQN
jgi:hypothetical protein